MIPALGYAAAVLVLAGCCAYAHSHDERVRAAVVRARWAWRCRGHPAITSERDPLDRDDMRAFLGLVRCWRQPAAPSERSRT